jgi:mono/diheme cytochrome c family protein
MKRVFACAVTIAFLGAASLSAKGEEENKYAQGKALYQQKCQMCHGEKGEGNGPGSVAFPTPPQNFTKPEFWQNDPDKKIMNAVEKGYKLMPLISLEPNQIKEIIDYITYAFKR